MIISPLDLSAKLLGKKNVTVKGNSGEDFTFEIQKVNIEIFAGEGVAKMDKLVGKTADEIKALFLNKFKEQEISHVISQVLLEGISSPKISNSTEYNPEKEVPLKVLLTDLVLATNLYIQILELTMKK